MFGTHTRTSLALLPAALCEEMSCLRVVSCIASTLNKTLTQTFDLSPGLNLTDLSRIVT